MVVRMETSVHEKESAPFHTRKFPGSGDGGLRERYLLGIWIKGVSIIRILEALS